MRKYQQKRRHWRGWPKFIGWVFMLAAMMMSGISISEANKKVLIAPSQIDYVTLVFDSLLGIIGFLVKMILDKMDQSQNMLFVLRRNDHDLLSEINTKLCSHIARCNTIMGFESLVRKRLAENVPEERTGEN